MTPLERGFLLLTSQLGDPDRKCLTEAQFRILAQRVTEGDRDAEDRDLTPDDLIKLGYGRQMAEQVVLLLSQEDLLEYYLSSAKKAGCVPITRVSPMYPVEVRKKLGLNSPGCLWAKGDLSLLGHKKISLVGSRDLNPDNKSFAAEVGRQTARQGYVLVSGNARGADRAGQDAALDAGGCVISVVADELTQHNRLDRMLYLSEDGFDLPFSAQRALSRNRIIHCLGSKTVIAQCALGYGGTWDGTMRNLRGGWSSVYCYGDGSEAASELEQMGAYLIGKWDLSEIDALPDSQCTLFDRG